MKMHKLLYELNLDKKRCVYCKIENPNNLVKCSKCQYFFCNNISDGCKYSHIIYHMKKSGHSNILTNPFNSSIKCKLCENLNIFELIIDNNEIYCLKCIKKSNKESFIHLVQDNIRIDPKIVPLSVDKKEIELINNISNKQIKTIENKISELNDVNEISIPKISLKYSNLETYYQTYKSLIIVEREYYKKLCENKQEIPVYLEFFKDDYSIQAKLSVAKKYKNEINFSIGNHLEFNFNNFTYECVILQNDIYKNIIIVYFKNLENMLPNGEYYIKEKINLTSFNRMLEGLDDFCFNNDKYEYTSRRIKNIILGKKKGSKKNEIEIPIDLNINNFPKLNESQIKALKHALKYPFTLIQGPPGTGKTTLITILGYHLFNLKKKDKKILICAPSNIAADNIANEFEKIKKFENYLRICSKNWEEKTTVKNCFHKLLEESNNDEFIDLHEKIKIFGYLKGKDYIKYIELLEKEEMKILSKDLIIITTCNSSYNWRLKNEYFSYIIIDESTQTTEPEALLPILHGSEHVVLIGDKCQLGPVIFNKKCIDNGLNISIFERLSNNLDVLILNLQYRMHPFLMKFPSKTFYNNQISSGINNSDREDDRIINFWPNFEKPSIFVNVSSNKEYLSERGTSYINEPEALLVKEFIDYFIKKKIKNKNIGVITPYIGQRNYLIDIIDNPSIEIQTVDAFQGREKDYIILSTVRSNKFGNNGFLNDQRRLNVILTRAKYGIIIIGDANCLNKEKNIWQNLIKYYKENRILVFKEKNKMEFYDCKDFNTNQNDESFENFKYNNEGKINYDYNLIYKYIKYNKSYDEFKEKLNEKIKNNNNYYNNNYYNNNYYNNNNYDNNYYNNYNY